MSFRLFFFFLKLESLLFLLLLSKTGRNSQTHKKQKKKQKKVKNAPPIPIPIPTRTKSSIIINNCVSFFFKEFPKIFWHLAPIACLKRSHRTFRRSCQIRIPPVPLNPPVPSNKKTSADRWNAEIFRPFMCSDSNMKSSPNSPIPRKFFRLPYRPRWRREVRSPNSKVPPISGGRRSSCGRTVGRFD